MTFFPGPAPDPGRHGTGQVAVTAFAVLPRSLGFWLERLVRHGIRYEGPTRQVISFKDHEWVDARTRRRPRRRGEARLGSGPGIPREHAIHGFHGVTHLADKGDTTEGCSMDTLGFRRCVGRHHPALRRPATASREPS